MIIAGSMVGMFLRLGAKGGTFSILRTLMIFCKNLTIWKNIFKTCFKSIRSNLGCRYQQIQGQIIHFQMKQLKTITLLVLLGTAAAAPAQNLLEDGRRLLEELDSIRDTATLPIDRRNAVQEVLTILARYDGPMQANTGDVSTAYQARLLEKAQANPLLREALQVDALSVLRIAEQEGALSGISSMGDDSESLKGRKRIEAIMYGGAPTSPAQYLSVQQSLQNSQVPPLLNSAAIQSAAENAQAPLSLKGLGVETVTQEVFEFLMERAKEEVAISFLDHLLKRGITEVDSAVFRNVRERFVNPADSFVDPADISASQSFLESLRDAFFLDLKSLPRYLPELLLKGNYFGELRDEPAFYGVMTALNLYGLSKNGTPPWESIPVAHRGLYDRFDAVGKNLNIRLAADKDSLYVSEEYRQMRDAAEEYVEKMDDIVFKLYSIESNISDSLRVVNNRNSTSDNNVSRSGPRPDFDPDPLFDYWVLTGRSDSTAAFHLGLLPELLDGELTDNTIFSLSPELESFDKFFALPYSEQEMRIAGLELARRLVDGSWYNDLTQVQIIRRWHAALNVYEAAADRWIISSDASRIEAEIAAAEAERQALHAAIDLMHSYWSDNKGERADLQALVMLRYIAEEFPPDTILNTPLDSLDKRQKFLRGIEQRMALVEQRLASNNEDEAADSPYQLYRQRQASQSVETEETRLRTLLVKIDDLQALADELRKALNRLDALQAPEENRAIQGASPMLQATELLSVMYSVFYDSEGEELIDASAFEDMLYQPELRAVCMGLLQQRLSRIKGLSAPSVDALAQYAQLTLIDFSKLKDALGGSFPEAAPDSSQLFQIASAGLQVLNRTLTFPLFADSTDAQKLVSLSQIHIPLKHVPEISEQCLMLLYNLDANQYRPAIGNMIRLLGSMSKQLGQTTEQNPLYTFLSKYGDFIAGLADAKSPLEMEHLLAGLAAPSGSARTKRTHHLSASLNAYLGITAGRERLTRGQSTPIDSSFFGLAPTIPIGLTVSRLCFRNSKRPQSFSLHLTAVDLGAMLTFRQIDEAEFGTQKLSIKNIVKPGIQVHWNIQETPLYMGLGWQSGPQFREENGREIALRSSRFFLAVGVDMPMLSLYARKDPRK